MTDYKNELRSVLYDFLGDFKEKRYLSEGNTDEAIAKLEALLSQRELEARKKELTGLAHELFEEMLETMELEDIDSDAAYAITERLKSINKLTNREEK